jgi:GTPase SAR1 family protein
VGKSTLILRYMLGKYIDESDPTIEGASIFDLHSAKLVLNFVFDHFWRTDIHTFEKNGIKLALWDYASREDFGIHREFQNLQETHGIFLCVSHDNSGALSEIQQL